MEEKGIEEERTTHKEICFCINFKESAFLFPHTGTYRMETRPGESYILALLSAWGKKLNQGSIYSKVSTEREFL